MIADTHFPDTGACIFLFDHSGLDSTDALPSNVDEGRLVDNTPREQSDSITTSLET